MSMESAFAPYEAQHKAEVMAATFGHVAPQPGVKYEGEILFAYGEFGDIVTIKSNFANLSDSPWFFDDLSDFICEKSKTEGTIYRFSGTYTKFKNGKCRFSGKVVEVKI